MHRLSIMDPAHGWQPFWDERSEWGVLGNGEIYNASALRESLRDRGHFIVSGSDIEVVPHLLEEYGIDAFTKLRGMFALAIFNRRDGEVWLVRDRMGEKPLSYWSDECSLFISSEQSALVRSGIVPLQIDETMLSQYLLYGYCPEPTSLISGVRKVQAGHVIRVRLTDGVSTEEPYWDPYEEVGSQPLGDDDLADALAEAVSSTCTSDVPVGLSLSGGLDSSLVAAIAADARTDLTAFTIGYAESGDDEAPFAQSLAHHLGIPCETRILSTSDIAGGFPTVCAARDEPISDIAGPAMEAVPRAASESGIRVLLTGLGGDELFWGYDWIRSLAAWSTEYLIESATGRNVTRPRFTSRPRSLQAQVDWLTQAGGLRTDAALRGFMSDGKSPSSISLPYYAFQPGFPRILQALRDLVGHIEAPLAPILQKSDDPAYVASSYTIAVLSTYLRVNGLAQVDRLSMYNSVESRTPLADAKLASRILAGRLVDKEQHLPPKARLRRVALRYLPPEVVARPKRGFTPPVRTWMRAIWAANEGALTAEKLIATTAMPPEATRAWMREPVLRSGQVNQVAMRLMTLELWLRSLAA